MKSSRAYYRPRCPANPLIVAAPAGPRTRSVTPSAVPGRRSESAPLDRAPPREDRCESRAAVCKSAPPSLSSAPTPRRPRTACRAGKDIARLLEAQQAVRHCGGSARQDPPLSAPDTARPTSAPVHTCRQRGKAPLAQPCEEDRPPSRARQQASMPRGLSSDLQKLADACATSPSSMPATTPSGDNAPHHHHLADLSMDNSAPPTPSMPSTPVRAAASQRRTRHFTTAQPIISTKYDSACSSPASRMTITPGSGKVPPSPGFRRGTLAPVRTPSQKAAFWKARRRHDHGREAVKDVEEEVLDTPPDVAEEGKLRCNQTLDFFHLAREMHVPLDMMKAAFDLFKDYAVGPNNSVPNASPGRLNHRRASLHALSHGAPVHLPEAVSTPSYRLAFEGHLTRQQFALVLCELAGCHTPDALPEALLSDSFVRADKNDSEDIDFWEFASWFVRHGFSEDVLLSKDEQYVRQVARAHDMPQSEVDHYRRVFQEFDIDGNDAIDSQEFELLLKKLLKVPEYLDLPSSRVRQFWQEVDMDGNGSINFEEFLLFYRKYFNTSTDARCPVEDYYQSFRRVTVSRAHP